MKQFHSRRESCNIAEGNPKKAVPLRKFSTMNAVKDISIEAYDYPLPDERIAKYPLPERDASKLLVLKDNEISESQFKYVGDFLPKDALLVFNETKVIRARLQFHKATGSRIEGKGLSNGVFGLFSCALEVLDRQCETLEGRLALNGIVSRREACGFECGTYSSKRPICRD